MGVVLGFSEAAFFYMTCKFQELYADIAPGRSDEDGLTVKRGVSVAFFSISVVVEVDEVALCRRVRRCNVTHSHRSEGASTRRSEEKFGCTFRRHKCGGCRRFISYSE